MVPEKEASSSLASPVPCMPSMRRSVRLETSTTTVRFFDFTLAITSGLSLMGAGLGLGVGPDGGAGDAIGAGFGAGVGCAFD
jgi:hypothetical protein